MFKLEMKNIEGKTVIIECNEIDGATHINGMSVENMDTDELAQHLGWTAKRFGEVLSAAKKAVEINEELLASLDKAEKKLSENLVMFIIIAILSALQFIGNYF